MIPTKTEDIQITSTIEGSESIRMQIDVDATEHIIALLTDLYSDPEMAIIREVSTNALDSHTAAGQTRPIEVTLPTPLTPQYKVQDWGLGLNAEDFRNIYSLYGKSTKTNTNDQTGSLGLGCKSPLTYTNQFTVVGVKDGVKTSAMVSRDEDGIPTIEIVDESPTDDPNGATVVIVAKDNFNELREKAERFFAFWPAGTILLNGTEPERLEDSDVTMKISDEASLCVDKVELYARRRNSFVVMCNVAYPIKDEYLKELDLGYYQFIVFQVQPGDVHFTPSREDLNYTTRTVKVIKGLVERYHKALRASIQAKIDACETKPEALQKNLFWYDQVRQNLIHKDPFTYHGETIPTTLHSPDTEMVDVQMPDGSINKVKQVRPLIVSGDTYGQKVGNNSSHVSIPLQLNDVNIFVYGFNRAFTPTVKKKLRAWCDERSIKHPKRFVMSVKRIRSPWLAPDTVHINWAEAEKIKLPRIYQTSSGKMAGSYFCYTPDDAGRIELQAEEIDDTGLVMYASDNGRACDYFRRLKMLDVYDNYTIAVVYTNRLNKFQSIFPDAKSGHEVIEEIYKTWVDSIPYHVRLAMFVKERYAAPNVILPNIADPDIKLMGKLMKVDTKREVHILKCFGYQSRSTNLIEEDEWDSPFDKYPLYSRRNSWRDPSDKIKKQHNTMYINMIYKEIYQNA